MQSDGKIVYPHSVWTRMRQLTDRKVTDAAVIELVNYVEDHVDDLILQVVEEHEDLNDARAVQGVYEKKMIDRASVRNAINIFNAASVTSMPDEGRSDKQEKPEVEKQHTQVCSLSEVM